jgi:NAD(P)-dependent dehydrogenase (short-subunit alcohol dehydrogenase family)
MIDCVARVIDRFGSLDMLHANAGIVGAGGGLSEASSEDFDQVIAINVRGTLNSVQAVVPHMKSRGKGTIVVTTSTAGLRPSPALGVYSISKYALIGLVKNASLELGPAGIRINGVAPGLIDTPAYRRLSQRPAETGEDGATIFATRVLPLGRIGCPDEVANIVTWLLSHESSYVTGSIYQIDGGLAA